jgi:SAM-dependent methyltransferase
VINYRAMASSEFDFARLYREHVRNARRPERSPGHWDGRAAGMSRRGFDGAYVTEFLTRMNLAGCATLLDIGCGPGTIALSAAPRLERVYGLDYSPGMLAAFEDNARQRGLSNATAILRSWDDDWSDVPACDVVVASRSTAVPDLEAALLKVDAKTRVRAYITYPADGLFLAGDVHRALGRPDGGLPDYLYVVGILHDLGFHPTLDYLPGENRFASCRTFEAFVEKVSDAAGPLTVEEESRLRRFYDEQGGLVGREPVRWALLSWDAGHERRNREP